MSVAGRIEGIIPVPAGVTLQATNSGGGPTAVPLTQGNYTPPQLAAHVQAQLNATRAPATWTVSIDTSAGGTGKTTINWTGAGTYSITWSDTNLRDAFGFTGNLVGIVQGVPSVSTKQARFLWLPDCPLNLKGDTRRAPLMTDAITTMSPRGDATTLVGNTFYRHQNLAWSAVANAKMWEQAAAIANASFEQFWKDLHLGQGGHAWATPGMAMMIYDVSGTLLGADLNAGAGPAAGWKATKGPASLEPDKTVKGWGGLWSITIPELVTSG